MKVFKGRAYWIFINKLHIPFCRSVKCVLKQSRIETPCQKSKMELFEKIVNDSDHLIIFAKHAILDVRQGSDYAPALINVEPGI